LSNYLIKQGQTWHVKVSIPADVQPAFEGRRAFKKTLKTSDKSVAIARSGPLVVEFKRMIEEARGNPTQHLDDYLAQTQELLRETRRDPFVDPEAISGIEDEVLDRLVKARGVQQPEQLAGKAEAEVVEAFKVTTGRLTRFAAPLEEYISSRAVEAKTEAKDRHAVTKFASVVSTVEGTNRQAVRDFVAMLSQKEGLKNRTIKDNLSTLRVYWKWLMDRDYAPEDRANPFDNVMLPPENRKLAAEKVRLPFSVEDIKRLHSAIESGRSEIVDRHARLTPVLG
jgi:hypothetical protein